MPNNRTKVDGENMKADYNYRKCVFCGKETKPSDQHNIDYVYDDEDELWCIPCAKSESDTGETIC